MNIKSLLLGSAAALAVVSGAQAADAVVAAEPEPMEYVRVCDAYGTGFWYIPGTETCIKLGGQYRYEKRWSKVNGAPSSYSNWSRGRLEVTAKNDSEWGTVSSWLRIQGATNDNLPNAFEAYYTFGIGGLEFGYYDSQWAQFGGYFGRTDWGGDYLNWTFGTRQYISYSASFDSVKAILSLEHDRNMNFDPILTTDGPDSKYMPDVVAGLSATMGDWSVTAMGAYDESDDSFAVTKIVRGDLGMFGVTLAGLYSNSATNSYFSYDGWSVIAGASAAVTDTVSLAADFQYWDNDDYRIIADASWAVASGFSVLLEGSYGDIGGVKAKTGMLRFQRKF